ncbi:MAG: hypothetical protein F4Y08_05030 [Caldilineaceae bacterium SB0662_bin_9]|uniref:Uncharacterized protein n=1 Tax=Caldilineaceae bacterium SB0662_bin_9 TaxID=2605258 RepID=A0A6B1DPN7_9CHLR|nr:hypothetical protein [Rhodospirillales bacterium]MYD89689.1 hypothetical protein [Caldilineaceae bacterium SB0662_bin_9]
MNRKLRDDLAATGIEPKAAVVLASLIPDVSALDDLHDRFDEFEATIDREFARQRRILTGLALLTIAAIVVSAILDGGGS